MKNKKQDNKNVPLAVPKEDGNCPRKESDNCLVPGGFNDSEPIGGG